MSSACSAVSGSSLVRRPGSTRGQPRSRPAHPPREAAAGRARTSPPATKNAFCQPGSTAGATRHALQLPQQLAAWRGARRRARAPRSGRAAGPPPRSAGSRPDASSRARSRGSGPPSSRLSSSWSRARSERPGRQGGLPRGCRSAPAGPASSRRRSRRLDAAGRRRAPCGGRASWPAARAPGSSAAPRARPRARSRALAIRSASSASSAASTDGRWRSLRKYDRSRARRSRARPT